MRVRLLIALSSAALAGGCGQQAAEPSNDAVATNGGAPIEATAEKTNSALGPAMSGDQAKTMMHDRHEGMEDIGKAFKEVNRQLKESAPDVAAIRTAASAIADGAGKSSGWFPPGTGPDVGKTRAKAEIWQKPQDFAAKDKAFQDAAVAFKAAADSGDLNAVRAQAGELGKSCKACHDPYRAPEGDHD
ncbi:MAG TPA: cytochrome c [Sphingomicrobium sp.]|nr:cytochrome c [Sphingomicrobium sp.]